MKTGGLMGVGAQSMDPVAADAHKIWYALVRRKIQLPPRIVTEGRMLYLAMRDPITKHEARAINASLYGKSEIPDTSDLFLGKVRLLASASKMGAWGWNLPAGPPQFGGTCPGAIPGFPMLDARQRRVALTTDARATPIDPDAFICGGCYALKGRYGSATMQAVMAARLLFTEWALDQPNGPKVFADYLERAILAGMVKSFADYRTLRKKRKYSQHAYAVHHPAFFRVHDSGDLFRRAYAFAWFEVAKRFSRPRREGKVTIPAITFWAPTRIWAVQKALAQRGCPQTTDMACAPPNLVIRPSSLHFGERAPSLAEQGYASGSASGDASIWSSLASWTCPAYLKPEDGGGAELQRGKYVKGCCARSMGPRAALGHKPDLRSPDGHGCRVCWTDPQMSVAYQEH